MVGYEEIRLRFGADDTPPRFIVHRGRLIIALCIVATMHPRIYADPAEVWIEPDNYLQEWGERLAWDTGAVSVFISPGFKRPFKEEGIYYVDGSTDDRVEIARRMAYPGAGNISRIVYLTGPHR